MTVSSRARRRFVTGAAAAAALGPLSVRAQAGYPSKNMRVVIPTGQGGGADRLARVFDDFWGPLLKTKFEYGFFAGAAGQVGYEEIGRASCRERVWSWGVGGAWEKRERW